MGKFPSFPGQYRIICLVCVLLAGCASPFQEANPVILPTLAAHVSPTAFPQLTKITLEPSPSPTPRPSPTSSPIPVPTKTDQPWLITVSESPDTEWSAAVFLMDREYSLQVVSRERFGTRWVLPEREENNLLAYPFPPGWSADGKSLVFSYQNKIWDGCFGSESAHGGSVWKLDLASGSTTQITQALGHWVALSPDGQRVAFLDTNTSNRPEFREEISIYDLQNGRTTRAEISFLTGQTTPIHSLDLLWSPDGKYLVFGALTNVCMDDDMERYTLIQVDAATLALEILLEEREEWLQPVKWSETGRILLRGGEGIFQWFRIGSRTLEAYP